jgi:enamine deaminase RidA (YjgF/YER057c/UK114 family)
MQGSNAPSISSTTEDSKPKTRHYRTANPYELEFGYSRAVRKGPFIAVSGTTSISPLTGVVQHPDSAYEQTRTIFAEITTAIEALGGTQADVVRLRMFVKMEEDAGDVSRALKEVFGEVAPTATMVFGITFVNPDMRVEIEADAIVL